MLSSALTQTRLVWQYMYISCNCNICIIHVLHLNLLEYHTGRALPGGGKADFSPCYHMIWYCSLTVHARHDDDHRADESGGRVDRLPCDSLYKWFTSMSTASSMSSQYTRRRWVLPHFTDAIYVAICLADTRRETLAFTRDSHGSAR